MLSRVEKFHQKKDKQLIKENEQQLSTTDRHLLKELYDNETDRPVKKKFNVNQFLNYGIVITAILLLIVLYIAFSK